MNAIDQNISLDKTIQSWGFLNMQSFAREQAKNILSQKIAHYKSKIEHFEEKYCMNFTEFCENFDQIKNHTIIEKEDDSMHWETAIDVLKSYEIDLLAIL